jgi:hypothetical protein
MELKDAAAAAKAIAPGALVPYHGSAAEIKKLVVLLDPSINVKEVAER